LDGDGAADLVTGELPLGQHGDERTESSLLVGRASWPARAGTEAFGLHKIVEPVRSDNDQFAYLGSGDLNGDGRDDLVSSAARTGAGGAVQSLRLALHWSPETWPARPDFTRGDVNLEVPSKQPPVGIAVGDVDGDGMADLLLAGEGGVDILRGRSPWPASASLEPPDTRIVPGCAVVQVGDVTGDGKADMLLQLDASDVDAAFIAGRSVWPSVLDARTEADFRIGSGRHEATARILPDLSGDGLPDIAAIDELDRWLSIYPSGTDVVARLRAASAAWSVTGVSDTFSVAAMDLTGDSVAELYVDRHAVIEGRPARTGSIDVGAREYDAEWPVAGFGPLWSLDVDGGHGADVLVGDSSASVQGRRGAGTIAIFLSPLFTPEPRTATATGTATSTAPAQATATATPTYESTRAPSLTIFLPRVDR
jgi:hypothetical protein